MVKRLTRRPVLRGVMDVQAQSFEAFRVALRLQLRRENWRADPWAISAGRCIVAAAMVVCGV
jgi:hypothetical protein